MGRILFKNVKIITENKILEGHSLVVENNYIKEIVFGEAKGDFDRVVDGMNKYLSPGFIDIHNHGNSGFDAMDSTYEALDTMAKYHIENGVTTFVATTMTASPEMTSKAIENAVSYMDSTRKNYEKAQVAGLYLEGPYFAMEKKGAQPAEYIANPDLKELEEYIRLGKGHIKIVALAPELKGAVEATKYLAKNNVVVSCGHSNATYDETMEAINNGATEATHIYNGMRTFTHREPGIIGATLLDDRVSCEMICDGIHLHDAAMEMVYRLKGREKVVLISDAMRATGLKDGEYDLGGQNVYVKGYEARLADGVLAGSTLTLNRAIRNMVDLVNVPLVDAVLMATLNGAEKIGIDNTKGSISVGKDADLVIFDEDVNIERVFIAGNEVELSGGIR